MKIFLFLLLLLPLNLWATGWQVEVGLGIDGETWKLEREKFMDGKEQTLNMGKNYVLKLTIKKGTQDKSLEITYVLHEKKGDKLILVNKGDDVVEEVMSKDIYAKGEPNQPNSIITLKLKNL